VLYLNSTFKPYFVFGFKKLLIF